MKARFGGVLAIALGTVLIVNGVSSASEGSVGVNPQPQCGAGQIGISTSGQCPSGGITITDTSPADASLPAAFDVTITSDNCLDTDGGPVSRTISVPVNGSAGTGTTDLYVFTNFGSTENGPKCEYTLTREANDDFDATFTPASPVTLPFSNGDRSNSDRVAQVNLVNAAADPEPTSEPSVTVVPSDTVEPSESGPQTDFTDTAAGSASAGAGDAGAGAAGGGSQSTAPIAATGPSQSITASLWLGIGLLFLGVFLLFEGRIRTFGRHRN